VESIANMNKGLSPQERMQRILQKQKEHEEKMRKSEQEKQFKSVTKPQAKIPTNSQTFNSSTDQSSTSTSVDTATNSPYDYQTSLRKRQEQAELRKVLAEEELRKKDQERKEEDNKIKGFTHDSYYYQYNQHDYTTTYKTKEELQMENATNQEKNEYGEVVGENWKRTEYGWQRGYDPQKKKHIKHLQRKISFLLGYMMN